MHQFIFVHFRNYALNMILLLIYATCYSLRCLLQKVTNLITDLVRYVFNWSIVSFSFYLFVVLTIYLRSRMQFNIGDHSFFTTKIDVKYVWNIFSSLLYSLTWCPLYLWMLYIIRYMICFPIISFIIGKMQKWASKTL